ncbi:UNVERIFIED_CONTAM: Retrovirus-related Pol polyprotein from transposon RE1 [Sesamum radiatum]|uniref:Retrovirus-related Pol polyprotein from transposon RE1 n=1 Tax=Sesamum radiatum TaxID=300843 RepID=A0AAW2R219_SESRA
MEENQPELSTANTSTNRSRQVVEIFSTCGKHRSLWLDLEARYGGSNGPMIYNLEREIGSVSQGNMSVTAYFTKIKMLWDELVCLDPVPACACPVHRQIMKREDSRQLMRFLMGLNNTYEHVRSQILLMEPRPHVQKAFSMVLSVEKQLSVQVQQSIGTAGAIYQVHHKDMKHKGIIDKRSMICDYCKRTGHLKEACFKLNGTPEWYKELAEKKKKGAGRGRGMIAAVDVDPQTTVSGLQGNDFSSILRAEIRKFMTENGSSHPQYNTPFDDVQINFAHMAELEESAGRIYCFNNDDYGSWIVDSGATRHVCANLKYFTNYFTPLKPTRVSLPDGSKKLIAHIGTVKLSPYITLEHVLYIPTFSVNLLSDQWTKETLAIGKLVGHLYILDSDSFLAVSSSQHSESTSVVLHSVADTSANDNSVIWQTPRPSKQQRLPFPNSDSQVTSVFDLALILWMQPYLFLLPLQYTTNTSLPHSATIQSSPISVTAPADSSFSLPTLQPTSPNAPPPARRNLGPISRLHSNRSGWMLCSKKFLHLKRTIPGILLLFLQASAPLAASGFFKLKMKDDGSVERCKARLVAKGFSQIEGVDYADCFSPVAKAVTVRLFLAISSSFDWPLHQLDVNNAFLHGYLEEEIYMQPPEGYLSSQAMYIARSPTGTSLTQAKYVQDILQDTGLQTAKAATTPLPQGIKLCANGGAALSDPEPYRRLVGRLLYLGFTRPDISYGVQQLSQFLQHPCESHWQAALHIVRYLKGTPHTGLFFPSSNSLTLQAFCDADWASCLDSRRSVTGFCVFLGTALISWKTKKQATVSRSSAEAEYRSMGATVCELQWISYLLHDFGIPVSTPIPMFCDNQAALHIMANPVFHERTKHLDIDCHIVSIYIYIFKYGIH